MDKIVVSRNSWSYKLAKFGGFKTYSWDTPSSCDYILSIFSGCFKVISLASMLIGAIFMLIVGLVSLGMPQEAINFIHSLRWLSFFWLTGFIAWVIIIAALFVLFMIWFADRVWPRIARNIGNLLSGVSDSRVIEHASDFMKGICKPVEIVD